MDEKEVQIFLFHRDLRLYDHYGLLEASKSKIPVLPVFIFTPEQESYNLISDIFAVMPAHMADSYFLYDEYERLHSTPWEAMFLEWLRYIKQYPEQDIQTHIHTRYCPHLMLMRNIITKGHNYVIENLPVSILR